MRRTSAVLVIVAVIAATSIATAAAQNTQRFSDVPPDHYAHEAINWAVETGITTGCGDGTAFCPDTPLNRAHVVTFLHRALAPPFAASGIGDDSDPVVTDNVRLEPGYYTVRVQIARAPGFDWSNQNDLRDFHAWLGSKADGWDVLDASGDWLPHTEFLGVRIDKTDDYWLNIQIDDEFVWWADVYERPLPEGVSFG